MLRCCCMATTDFAEWLNTQLKIRDMSPAELSRKAGIDKGVISRALSRERKLSPDTLEAVARAFRLPLETVFRAAGLLPAEQEADALVEEGLYILQQLKGEDKEDAIRYLRMRLEVAEEKGEYHARKRKG